MTENKIQSKINNILNSDEVLYVREYDLGNTYSGFQTISDPCDVLYFIEEDNKFLISYKGGSNTYYKIVPLEELKVEENEGNLKRFNLDLDDGFKDIFGHKNVVKGFNGRNEYIAKNEDTGHFNVISKDMIDEILY